MGRHLVNRRDFIVSTFGTAALSTWASGCSKPSPRIDGQLLNGQLLGQNANAGHRLRTEEGFPENAPTLECDVVIVGAGPSGLAAARELSKRDGLRIVQLELEDVLGGTSRSAELGRGAKALSSLAPWGAHYLPLPRRYDSPLSEFLHSFGAITGEDDQGRPIANEAFLVRDPEERVFDRGRWNEGILPKARVDAASTQAFAAFEADLATFFAPNANPRSFDLPSRLGVDALDSSSSLHSLETQSAAQWLDQRGHTHPLLRWHLDYGTRDDYGTSLEQTSAYALLHYQLSRKENASPESAPFLSWPEGNAFLCNQLRGQSSAFQSKTNFLAMRVVRSSDGKMEVCGYDLASNDAIRYRCNDVVLCVAPFIAARLLRKEIQAASQIPMGSWMVANIHLKDRPRSTGFPFAWDNVLFDSPSLGYVASDHQRGRDHGRTTWTYYLPLVDDQPARARQRLFDGAQREWSELIYTDLKRAHHGLDQCLEGIDVFRWGHAMVEPRPGARQQLKTLRESLQEPGIELAHAGWTAFPLFEEAFDQGREAALRVLAKLQTQPKLQTQAGE